MTHWYLKLSELCNKQIFVWTIWHLPTAYLSNVFPWVPSYDFMIFILFLLLRSLISHIMCITCHGITPTMLPHPRISPLNQLAYLRTPVDL